MKTADLAQIADEYLIISYQALVDKLRLASKTSATTIERALYFTGTAASSYDYLARVNTLLQ